MSRPALAAGVAVCLLASALNGCVYYNAMYNTKRLARSAQKADRDGRTFEAINLWGQVATRAESVVVRHPRSKYVDEAMVLRGLALARLGQCPTAVAGLERVTSLEPGSDVSEEAALALGRCRVELGDPATAQGDFARVAESRDDRRRAEARRRRAHALRLDGRHQEALDLLQGITGPGVEDERLLALSGAGRKQEALALADSLLTGVDTTRAWDSVLTALGRQDPLAASALVDRLESQPSLTTPIRARRLLADGDRLGPVDPVRAARRLREAAQMGAGTEAGDHAALRLLRLDLAAVRDLAGLAPIVAGLDTMMARPGAVASEAARLRLVIESVRTAADSSGPEFPGGDLRLFLAGEAAREILQAPILASTLFRRIAEERPGSPYAPKALLASQPLDSSWADTARTVLMERYAGSPYLAALRGEDAPEFRALEDSLRAFAMAQPALRAAPPLPGRGDPDQLEQKPTTPVRRAPVEDPSPGARRQPEP